MKAKIFVNLKTGVLDPQGQAIKNSLNNIGLQAIEKVKQGKVFEVEVNEKDQAKAKEILTSACDRLLANTVIENYEIEIL